MSFQMPKNPQVAIVPDAPVEVRETPPAEDSLLARIHEQGRDVIRLHGLNAFAAPRLVPDQSVRFVLDGDQLFDPGKAQIKTGARGALRLLVVASAPYRSPWSDAAADDAGPGAPSAWELSTARASALANFLTSVGLPGPEHDQ